MSDLPGAPEAHRKSVPVHLDPAPHRAPRRHAGLAANLAERAAARHLGQDPLGDLRIEKSHASAHAATPRWMWDGGAQMVRRCPPMAPPAVPSDGPARHLD